jgi:uncharacterized cupin superfamily protein
MVNPRELTSVPATSGAPSAADASFAMVRVLQSDDAGPTRAGTQAAGHGGHYVRWGRGEGETRETLNVDQARIDNGVPTTAGWFVINAAEAPWMHNEMRAVCKFGGEGPAHFDQLGIGLYWIEPGKPMTLYHHEAGQEDFLVLRGECILVIEGEERALAAWDFVHCPPGTSHTIVAAGEVPALIFAVGARKERASARYPLEPVAVRHGAGVPSEQTTARDHYATFGTPQQGSPPTVVSGSQRG